jgi:hypothetical protein
MRHVQHITHTSGDELGATRKLDATSCHVMTRYAVLRVMLTGFMGNTESAVVGLTLLVPHGPYLPSNEARHAWSSLQAVAIPLPDAEFRTVTRWIFAGNNNRERL